MHVHAKPLQIRKRKTSENRHMKDIVYSAKLYTVEDLKQNSARLRQFFLIKQTALRRVLFGIHTDKKLLGIHVNFLYIKVKVRATTIFEATSQVLHF
jgi:hypothetical protein